MPSEGNAFKALVDIQSRLKAPKDQNAGRYRYRNIEDINQAVKPLAAEHGCAVVYADYFQFVEQTGAMLCESSCTLACEDGSKVSARSFSIVNTSPKGMSIEQSCGAASSYARKYAACGLFAIDSSENDPDRTNAAPAKAKEPDGMDAAKQRMWAAIKRYAELQGEDPKQVAAGVKARNDYRDTEAFYSMVADEFEGAI